MKHSPKCPQNHDCFEENHFIVEKHCPKICICSPSEEKKNYKCYNCGRTGQVVNLDNGCPFCNPESDDTVSKSPDSGTFTTQWVDKERGFWACAGIYHKDGCFFQGDKSKGHTHTIGCEFSGYPSIKQPTSSERIESVLKEFEEKFFNEETDLRNWVIKQAIQRPEQIDWLRTTLQTIEREAYERGVIEGLAERQIQTSKEQIKPDEEQLKYNI